MEIHYEHPTPDELRVVADEVVAIRSMLVEARSRLFWVSRGLRPGDPRSMPGADFPAVRDWTETAEKALTPLVVYLYEPGLTILGWATAKEVARPEWVASPHHRIEPGWPPR